MTDDADFLRRVLELLRAAGIPHMVTGSFVSSTYGEARTTQDLDVVIDPTPEQLRRFLASLDPAAYYVSPEAANDALARRSMFNVIDFQTGWKADLIVLKTTSAERRRFARRILGQLLGQRAEMATPEDSILSKLEWRKETGSERQFRDAVQVAANRWATLDQGYLREAAAEIGVSQEMEEVLRQSDELRPKH
jgi:hypothetical protein